MATPKVFISSTCFDLLDIRDRLEEFITSYGFIPVRSDAGDIPYTPDEHTHQACINEVTNCQLFILVIGGRYGGRFIGENEDNSISITQAEYNAARAANIPIFTYIKDKVLDNHHTYNSNKKKDFIKELHFPAIEKQEHAIDIFKFIDAVRYSPNNNSYESFSTYRDIEFHFRKQLAGFFYDLLKSRSIKSDLHKTQETVELINDNTNKLEQLIKLFHQNNNNGKPDSDLTTVQDIDIEATLVKLCRLLNSKINYILGHDIINDLLEISSDIDPSKYSSSREYLSEIVCYILSSEKPAPIHDDHRFIATVIADHINTKLDETEKSRIMLSTKNQREKIFKAMSETFLDQKPPKFLYQEIDAFTGRPVGSWKNHIINKPFISPDNDPEDS